jgi:hypothetical protein
LELLSLATGWKVKIAGSPASEPRLLEVPKKSLFAGTDGRILRHPPSYDHALFTIEAPR